MISDCRLGWPLENLAPPLGCARKKKINLGQSLEISFYLREENKTNRLTAAGSTILFFYVQMHHVDILI